MPVYTKQNKCQARITIWVNESSELVKNQSLQTKRCYHKTAW